MKIRIKFAKYGTMKFIGHLDVMRFFQKVFRRANVDIAFSEGMSPHMILSFAAPLGLGAEGMSEYADIQINSSVPGASAAALPWRRAVACRRRLRPSRRRPIVPARPLPPR